MDDNGANDEQDTYVTQLREVFDSCDGSGNGFLNQEELYDLCDKLQLHDQTGFFLKRLLQKNPDAKVSFVIFQANVEAKRVILMFQHMFCMYD